MAVRPAAGPLTLVCDPLMAPTSNPPTIPARIPEISGAPEASATPKQSGSATKKTTMLALKSRAKFPRDVRFIEGSRSERSTLLLIYNFKNVQGSSSVRLRVKRHFNPFQSGVPILGDQFKIDFGPTNGYALSKPGLLRRIRPNGKLRSIAHGQSSFHLFTHQVIS